MNETIQTLGNIGEFIGALLVAITLIYIAIQTRQATRNSEILKGQNIANVLGRFNEKMVESEEVAAIWLKGIQAKEELSPVEEVRFKSLWTLWTHYPRTIWVSGERDTFAYAGWAQFLHFKGARASFDQGRFPPELRDIIWEAFEAHCQEDAQHEV